jgi:hypothetical protein
MANTAAPLEIASEASPGPDSPSTKVKELEAGPVEVEGKGKQKAKERKRGGDDKESKKNKKEKAEGEDKEEQKKKRKENREKKEGDTELSKALDIVESEKKKKKKKKEDKEEGTGEEEAGRREKRRKEKEDRAENAEKKKGKEKIEKLGTAAPVAEMRAQSPPRSLENEHPDTAHISRDIPSTSATETVENYPDQPPPPYTPQPEPAAQPEPAQSSYDLASRTPGTAEYLALKLVGPGHSCRHFPKLSSTSSDAKIPTILGFFHASNADSTDVSYVDTRKLCKACYDDAVPQGYSVWTTYASIVPASPLGCMTSGAEKTVTIHRKSQGWLDPASASAGTTSDTKNAPRFPTFISAGTELFTDDLRGFLPSEIIESPEGKKVGHRNIASPIPMPTDSEAKKAWEWLKSERRPFYMDQLHLVHGWNVVAEHKAQADARVAVLGGTAYAAKKKVQKEKLAVETDTGPVKVNLQIYDDLLYSLNYGCVILTFR